MFSLMNSSITKTLLALLLALKELKVPLNRDEQELLQGIGAQLAIPDYWDSTEEELMTMIEANTTFHHLYLSNKAKLDALEGVLPLELLPSPDDLVAEFSQAETREVVTFNGQPKNITYSQTNQVIEFTSVILTTKNQDQTVKQVSSVLEPLSDYIQNYRYFNTYFSNPSNRTIIPPTEPLIHGQVYTLLVDISPEKKGIDTDSTLFPDDVLAQVWHDQETLSLDVVVTAKEQDFSIDTPVKQFTLPRIGASNSIKFTVKPNLLEGRGYIQAELFYRGYLLQSKQITVLIIAAAGSEIPESLRPPQTAHINFTTTNLLTNQQLALLPERVLTVNVERDQRDGSVDFRFLDRTQSNKEIAFYDTILQPAALGEAIATVRLQLKLLASSDEGYMWKSQGDIELLNTWLPKLAGAGRNLYRAILPENKSQTLGEDQGEKLRAVLQPGTVIQVNPVSGNLTIPWALLYERKLTTISSVRGICNHFLEHDLDCTGCPLKSDTKIVCPHAFWGYRYAIEQLPAWTTNELPQFLTLVRQISNEETLSINFNVWRDFSLWRDHLDKIQQIGKVEILIAEETSVLEHIWAEHSPKLDLVYFYCHGGVDESSNRPYLKLSNAEIDSLFLDACELNWPHHPLVLLNGCATGDYNPESYISLINDFRAAGASGVIGTECPVPEMFAEPYAFALLTKLFQGEPLGQAMLTVRKEILRNNLNPLGLVYSLYAPHEIALACAVAH